MKRILLAIALLSFSVPALAGPTYDEQEGYLNIGIWAPSREFMEAHPDVKGIVEDMRRGVDVGNRVQAAFNRYILNTGDLTIRPTAPEALAKGCHIALFDFWGVDTTTPKSEMAKWTYTARPGQEMVTHRHPVTTTSSDRSIVGRGHVEATFGVHVCDGLGALQVPWDYLIVDDGEDDAYLSVWFPVGGMYFPDPFSEVPNGRSIDVRSKELFDAKSKGWDYVLLLAVAEN